MNTVFKVPAQQRRRWLSRPRPKALARSLEAIPLTAPHKATAAMNGMLENLNSIACSPRRRALCLAHFQAPARFLHRELERVIMGETVPLTGRVQARADQMAELWGHIAVGYLSCAHSGHRLNPTLHGAVLLRALQALGRLIALRYHCYAPVPPGAWQAVHSCNQLAGQAGQRHAEAVPERDSADATDLDTAYRQILILGGTDPYRLRRSEQVALYQVLAHWARLVQVRPLHGPAAKGAALVFRPGDDEAPALCPESRLPDSPGLRMLDLAPLAARAHHRLSLLEARDGRPRLSGTALQADTLRILISSWSGAPQRRFPRVRADQTVRMCLGLDTIHETLTQPDRDYPVNGNVVSQSTSGYGLALDGLQPGCLRVGELILLRASDSEQLVLGVLRWLRHDQGSRWLAGTEALTRDAAAVSLVGKSRTTGASRAILIPANAANYSPATLITNRQFAAEDDHQFRLIDGTHETPLALGRQVEVTGSFCQYRVLENGG